MLSALRPAGAPAVPGAVLVALERWGHGKTEWPMFEAVTVDEIDRWLVAPEAETDEECDHAVTELLEESAGRAGGG